MRRRSLRAAPRRKLIWARLQQTVTVPTVASPALAAPARIDVLAPFVAAYGASLIGTTAVRIRGIMAPSALQAAQASITAAAYIGDANDIVRGPNANDNYYDSNSRGKDYFLVEPFIAPVSGSAAQAHLTGTDIVGRVIDVKAQRKLDEVSQRVILDVSGFSAAVSNQVFTVDLSMLVMLP